MNTSDFLTELSEELELENNLTLDTNLKELDEWDSMTAMLLIGYVSSNFDITLSANDLDTLTDVNSLVDRIGAEKFS